MMVMITTKMKTFLTSSWRVNTSFFLSHIMQCFGSGSAWIRNKFVSRIQIRIPNADPDPAADKISSKSQNNSYHLELFD